MQVGNDVFPATADAAGAWEVVVNHGAGNVTVATASGEVAKAANAAQGDVFFCAGQSNMVFPMKLTFNSTEEMATLKDFPQFSFFMTALDYADTPQFNLKPDPSECVAANASLCARSCAAPGTCNRWVTAAEAAANNNSYLSQFSAACFMTARDVAKMHTGSRPVGLVLSAWGGTRVEAWMSTDAIAAASKAVVPGQVISPSSHTEQNNISALCVNLSVPYESSPSSSWIRGCGICICICIRWRCCCCCCLLLLPLLLLLLLVAAALWTWMVPCLFAKVRWLLMALLKTAKLYLLCVVGCAFVHDARARKRACPCYCPYGWRTALCAAGAGTTPWSPRSTRCPCAPRYGIKARPTARRYPQRRWQLAPRCPPTTPPTCRP